MFLHLPLTFYKFDTQASACAIGGSSYQGRNGEELICHQRVYAREPAQARESNVFQSLAVDTRHCSGQGNKRVQSCTVFAQQTKSPPPPLDQNISWFFNLIRL